MSLGVLSLGLCAWVIYIEHSLAARVEYPHSDKINAERARIIQRHHGQQVTLVSSDTNSVAGLLVERPAAQRVFLVVHGYKQTKESLSPLIDIFPQDTLLFIDLRGQGQSEGKRVSLGLDEHHDVMVAVEYLKDRYPELPVIGLGISLGGSALLRAAAEKALLSAVISDSAPCEFKWHVTRHLWEEHHIPFVMGWLALSWYEFIMGQSFKQSDYRYFAPRITMPVLIMHDPEDASVSYENGLNLYGAVGSTCKKLYTAQGTHHGKMFKEIPDKYRQAIEQFLSSCH